MRKLILIAKRDYLASVRTKAFVFGLVVAPILFGGCFLGVMLTNDSQSMSRKRVAVVDRSGIAGPSIVVALNHSLDRTLLRTSVSRGSSQYIYESVKPDSSDDKSPRSLWVKHILSRNFFAVLEIGSRAIQPGDEAVFLYAQSKDINSLAVMAVTPVNEAIRRVRLEQLGIPQARAEGALAGVRIQAIHLEEKTGPGPGTTTPLVDSLEGKNLAVSVFPVMLLVMIVMFTSAPMLPAIAEDKLQRVFEMLLISATPFDLVGGKIAASVGRALTSAGIYMVVAIPLVKASMTGVVAPWGIVWWFIVFLIVEVVLLSAFAAGLGSLCASPQDSQSLGLVLLLPVMVPLFLIIPVLRQANGTVATIMSMVPPFTPILMLLRQSSSNSVPSWQPWIGLLGVIGMTAAMSVIATRVFRFAILLDDRPAHLLSVFRVLLTHNRDG